MTRLEYNSNLRHTYQMFSRSLLLQLQLMCTIVYLIDISNRKHLKRSSWAMSPKHCTSMSLAIKYICFSLIKFVLINLYLYSKLMIFIGYENNSYWFMCHTQENVILHSIHAIFNEKFFSKYTNFHVKEHKLYNKLLDKISPETELLMPEPSSKDGPAPVSVQYLFYPYPFLLFKIILLLILFLF